MSGFGCRQLLAALRPPYQHDLWPTGLRAADVLPVRDPVLERLLGATVRLSLPRTYV